MDQHAPDLTCVLPAHLYHHVVHALRAALPPPPADTQADLVRRDHAAIAQVAALLPANGEEVVLAAQFVAANAQALDCLRLARQSPSDTLLGLKCMAQSASMMRQARGARSLLLTVQARRLKREAIETSSDGAARIEHCAIGLMTDALEAAAPGAKASVIVAPPAETPGTEGRADETYTVSRAAENRAADAPRANTAPTPGTPANDAQTTGPLVRASTPHPTAAMEPAPAPVPPRAGPRHPAAPPKEAPGQLPGRRANQPDGRAAWATVRPAYEAIRAGP